MQNIFSADPFSQLHRPAYTAAMAPPFFTTTLHYAHTLRLYMPLHSASHCTRFISDGRLPPQLHVERVACCAMKACRKLILCSTGGACLVLFSSRYCAMGGIRQTGDVRHIDPTVWDESCIFSRQRPFPHIFVREYAIFSQWGGMGFPSYNAGVVIPVLGERGSEKMQDFLVIASRLGLCCFFIIILQRRNVFRSVFQKSTMEGPAFLPLFLDSKKKSGKNLSSRAYPLLPFLFSTVLQCVRRHFIIPLWNDDDGIRGKVEGRIRGKVGFSVQ